MQEETYYIHDDIPLILEVQDDLNSIYRIMWDLEDRDNQGDYVLLKGEDMLDQYDESQLLELFQVDEMNYDQMTIFIPDVVGVYKIGVSGFYKQTNSQPITYIEVIVD